MINCGATEDVRSLLDTAGPATRIVVADARRPVHHSFNHEGDAGCVLLHCRDDETARVEDVPLPDGASEDEGGEEEGYEEGEEGGAGEDNDEENNVDRGRRPFSPSDNDDENNAPSTSDASDGGNGRPSQRRRLAESQGGVLSPARANANAGGGANNNDNDNARGKNPAFAAADAAKAARARARAIRAYRRAYYERGGGSAGGGGRSPFSGLGSGKPASATLFELAHALRADDGHALWLAAVGLADAWTSERLARPGYERLTGRLETLAACLPGASDDEVVSVRVEADVGGNAGSGGENGGNGGAAMMATTATLRARLFGKVSPFDDLAVPLLRHWSAYDALAHAPRVAIPLGTWSEAGRRRLEELLARMGLPLAGARAGACTGAGGRRAARLPAALAVHGGGYRIPALSFRSFRLAWDGDRLAAADVAAAAGALLEAAGGSVGSGGGGGGGNAAATAAADGSDEPAEDPSTSAAAATARDAFWRSWNALAAGKRPRDVGSELAEGLALARRLRAAVLADGGALLARRKVRESPAGKFRWADLSSGDAVSHRALFSRPAPLARLASFLRDVYAAGGGGAGIGGAGAAGTGLGTGRRVPRAARRRAVVLIGPRDAGSGRCAVVAVGPYKASESEEAERAANAAAAAAAAGGGRQGGGGNALARQPRFGMLFRRAAAAVGADLGRDGFDGAAASLPAEDVERFMRELTVVAAGAQLASSSSAADEALAGLLG